MSLELDSMNPVLYHFYPTWVIRARIITKGREGGGGGQAHHTLRTGGGIEGPSIHEQRIFLTIGKPQHLADAISTGRALERPAVGQTT